MPIIQITNTYSGAVLDVVRECVPEGFEIRLLQENSQQALLSSAAEADYLLASGRVRIDKDVLSAASNLKMIQRTGVGLDTLDMDAIRHAGIPLYVNRGINAQSVAEHTLLLILACLRRLPELDANSKKGIWEKQAQGIRTRQLSGRTVGVIGMGSIGRRVAQLLRAFDAKTVYCSGHRLSEEQEKALGARYMETDELFACSEVITLHCALTDKTRQLVNERTLGLMRSGAVLVNTARGALIDERALSQALKSGKIAYAGLDVHADEPYSDSDALIRSERVIATPHVGGITYDSFRAMMSTAMRNIACFHTGKLDEIQKNRIL